ncbi:MAG: alcohol dehydrogenase catalytic domain-containing protein [Gaiella sp.]|nr:alcohol dehydrogenase catalytic domain-containing protein [Gaiella sp.]
MRAVVVGPEGEAALAEVPEPEGPGDLFRVVACGLCGSDVEKLDAAHAGVVLGHEVVGEAADGRRVALVHHTPCGACERCRAGHETTCKRFAAPTIRPGGFAERVRADGWVELPEEWPAWRGTMVEPLACVLRGVQRVPQGRVLIVGNGFVGRLVGAVLERRDSEVFAVDTDPRRAGRAPDGPVDAAVLCGQGGVETALETLAPGGTLLVFADAGRIPAEDVYRRELTAVGSRSATPAAMQEAVALLDELEVPEPTVLPLERFVDGLSLFRGRDALKVVFTP